ncbi:MAG TPA: flagellar basal body rod protein FlgG [Clostridium sp.]|uniref:Flagellar basal-body rod protein FlgG n=1 Tax=Clostridium lapidicellarium TaxID=3240931 RepID=A0ABV4DSW2_9CLOT|nr:flagellar basal-body rod protein FlgG [uncultured Clostridium sp.]NLU08024.1 flagellar basal body rod protein FlgG [Clostridiales bacterium]HBC95908.1 flagellar basal body rod protein FlgG [Clostridium sp.]
MLRSIWNSRSAMNAQQEKLDCISNNIANINTVGYKKEDVDFQDLMYETLRRVGYPTNPDGINTINGTGVKTTNWISDTSQGSVRETGLRTDMAIDGSGFFRVTLPNGTPAYERSGNFSIDASGNLVDADGNKLEVNLTPEGTALFNSGTVFKDDNFTVDTKGRIYMNVGNNTILYGKINVYNVIGQDSMRSIGDNLFVPQDGAQMVLNDGADVLQGYLEQSNVDLGQEITDMILAQRSFELASKGLTTADEMWGLINSMRR